MANQKPVTYSKPQQMPTDPIHHQQYPMAKQGMSDKQHAEHMQAGKLPC
jgi:hypothetical protein